MGIGEFFESPILKNVRSAAGTINAVVFFSTSIATVATVAYLAWGRKVNDSKLAAPVGVVLLGWFVTVIGLYIYVRKFYEPPDYELLEVEGSLLVEASGDHYRYTYVKKQTVRALRPDIRVIEFKAHWTGQSSTGKPVVRPVYGDHVVLDGKHSEEDGRVHRWVYPGGPVGRGHKVDVGIRHVHEDDLARQRPYFRDGGGRYRTAKLTVTVKFPRDQDPSPVSGAVWNTHLPVGQNNQVGDYPFDRRINLADNTVEYIVTVRRPKRHHSYGVRWNWPTTAS
ncbi:hypothetical protein ACPPVO_12845 [Dactylosporangium sp. McL0621]|uniref:hypothetical protein n=1 Tax=Dactylosporangium sp. McL0621 TaxID=3415678 RepID=UPI003CF19FCC